MTEDVDRRAVASSSPRKDADWVPNPRRWRILSVSLVVGFMSLLYVSIVNVAIPSMQQGLGTSPSVICWRSGSPWSPAAGSATPTAGFG